MKDFTFDLAYADAKQAIVIKNIQSLSVLYKECKKYNTGVHFFTFLKSATHKSYSEGHKWDNAISWGAIKDWYYDIYHQYPTFEHWYWQGLCDIPQMAPSSYKCSDLMELKAQKARGYREFYERSKRPMPVMILISENGNVYGRRYCDDYMNLCQMAQEYKREQPNNEFLVFHNDAEAKEAGY